MFVLDPTPTFTHPVTVQVPVDGGHDAQTFKVTYAVIGDAALAEFDLNDRASSSSFLAKVVVGFDEVRDQNDQAIPFSDRARDALIDLPFVRVPMVKGYFDAVYKAQMGN